MAEVSLTQRTLPSAVVRRWTLDVPLSNLSTVHEGFEVAWCYEGLVEYRTEGRLLQLRPGSAIVVPPMVEHATGIASNVRAGSLHLAADGVAKVLARACCRLTHARLMEGSSDQPAELAALGERLDREVWNEGPEDAIVPLLDQIISAVANTGEPLGHRRHDHRIQRAVERIHERYAESLTLDDLARTATMSRFHFSRLFRIVTGKTPHKYLLDVRLARAAGLLSARQCSVTEAALRVGYNDIGRFGRMFRQAHGVAPSEYLRASRLRCQGDGAR